MFFGYVFDDVKILNDSTTTKNGIETLLLLLLF